MDLGGLLGFGNSAAKRDRSQINSVTQSQQDIQDASRNLFNTGLPAANATTSNAMTDLDTASDWWKSIIGSNQGAMKAAAPAVNAINDEAAANRLGYAQFGTARGGGVNAGLQKAETNRMAQINKAIFATQPAAAQQLQSAAVQKAQIGQQQLAQSLQALGISAQEARDIANEAAQNREFDWESSPARAIESTLGEIAQNGIKSLAEGGIGALARRALGLGAKAATTAATTAASTAIPSTANAINGVVGALPAGVQPSISMLPGVTPPFVPPAAPAAPGTAGGGNIFAQGIKTAAQGVKTGVTAAAHGAEAAGKFLMSNPVTAAIGAGIIGTIALIKSQAHWEANDWVQHYQQPFDQSMKRLSMQYDQLKASGQLDPQSKSEIASAMQGLVSEYRNKMEEFKKRGKDNAKVIEQSKAEAAHWYGPDFQPYLATFAA